MDLLSKVLTSGHVIAGFLSIVVFWIPVFAKKGGKLHNSAGQVYVKLMWLVVITAFLLSIKNVIIGRYFAATFLGYLSLITSGPLWFGIAILKNKRELSETYKKRLLAFHFSTVIFGAALVITGIYLTGHVMAVMMIIFGILGVANIGELIKGLKDKPSGKTWIQEHISGMIITGIAAYTAFAAFGGSNYFRDVFSGYWMIVPWVGPTVIGFVIIGYMNRKNNRFAVKVKLYKYVDICC